MDNKSDIAGKDLSPDLSKVSVDASADADADAETHGESEEPSTPTCGISICVSICTEPLGEIVSTEVMTASLETSVRELNSTCTPTPVAASCSVLRAQRSTSSGFCGVHSPLDSSLAILSKPLLHALRAEIASALRGVVRNLGVEIGLHREKPPLRRLR